MASEKSRSEDMERPGEWAKKAHNLRKKATEPKGRHNQPRGSKSDMKAKKAKFQRVKSNENDMEF